MPVASEGCGSFSASIGEGCFPKPEGFYLYFKLGQRRYTTPRIMVRINKTLELTRKYQNMSLCTVRDYNHHLKQLQEAFPNAGLEELNVFYDRAYGSQLPQTAEGAKADAMLCRALKTHDDYLKFMRVLRGSTWNPHRPLAEVTGPANTAAATTGQAAGATTGARQDAGRGDAGARLAGTAPARTAPAAPLMSGLSSDDDGDQVYDGEEEEGAVGVQAAADKRQELELDEDEDGEDEEEDEDGEDEEEEDEDGEDEQEEDEEVEDGQAIEGAWLESGGESDSELAGSSDDAKAERRLLEDWWDAYRSGDTGIGEDFDNPNEDWQDIWHRYRDEWRQERAAKRSRAAAAAADERLRPQELKRQSAKPSAGVRLVPQLQSQRQAKTLEEQVKEEIGGMQRRLDRMRRHMATVTRAVEQSQDLLRRLAAKSTLMAQARAAPVVAEPAAKRQKTRP